MRKMGGSRPVVKRGSAVYSPKIRATVRSENYRGKRSR